MNHHSENVDWFNSIKPSKKQVVPEVVRKSLQARNIAKNYASSQNSKT